MIPHHCLGSIWSQRDKKDSKHSAPTIRATIAQFNAVTACVVSTILKHRRLRPHVRARVIQRWIEIAQVRQSSRTFRFSGEAIANLRVTPPPGCVGLFVPTGVSNTQKLLVSASHRLCAAVQPPVQTEEGVGLRAQVSLEADNLHKGF